jgi:uncharacterized low-complexity protein
MSINFRKNTAYLSAVGTVFAVSLSMSPTADAASSANPFLVADLGSGYMVAASEGKCGEGKCAAKSGDKKAGEGNCAGEKGKEGDCSAKKDKEHEKKGGEGKCGEGKCASA